jgi:restriction endonuclease S subunit/predicted GIY-YIG superfamily endonuclease
VKLQNTECQPQGGWTVTTLGELLEYVTSGSRDWSQYYSDHGAKFIRTQDINTNRLRIDAVARVALPEKVEGKRTRVFEGDILITITGANVGKVALVDNDIGEAYVSQSVALVRLKDKRLGKFLHYQLITKFGGDKTHLEAMAYGLGRPVLNLDNIRDIPVRLVPFDQQKRIVAEIEKQFSRLDEGVANLKRVKANLKRYKAAVLKAAVEGKLTEEWRKAHLPAPTSRPGKFYTYAILCDDDSIYIGHTDNIGRRWRDHRDGKGADWTKEHKPIKIVHYEEYDSREEAADREKWLKTGYGRKWIKRELAAGRTRQAGDVEPASELLKRILAERRAKWDGKGKYKEPAVPDRAGLPLLSEGWTWASPGQLSSAAAYSFAIGPFGSNLKVSDYTNSGVPLIFVRNIRSSRFGGLGTQFVSKAKAEELIAHQLSGGDVLITKMGDPPGDACLYPDTAPDAIITADCIKLRPSPLIPDKRFIVHAINSQVIKSQILRITKGVAQLKVSLARFGGIAIPLPPLAEQERIVAEVERRLSLVEEFEALVVANLQRADRLRQIVLQRAFSGGFFRNDSTKTERNSYG